MLNYFNDLNLANIIVAAIILVFGAITYCIFENIIKMFWCMLCPFRCTYWVCGIYRNSDPDDGSFCSVLCDQNTIV
jgi:hypothetical protein